jgi:phosphatidylglycerophosphate synthase
VFDAQLRRLIDPVLDRLARALAKANISANAVTCIGALLGIGAAICIGQGQYLSALGLITLNRLADGLDGLLARLRGATAFGGYLDSLADYIFYIAIPIGFAWADPASLWPALILIASFTLTAVSFLALAAIMAGRDLGHGEKAFTYTTGLIEGGETIAFFITMCLLPTWFHQLGYAFAVLCILTVCQRLWLAHKILY